MSKSTIMHLLLVPEDIDGPPA